MKNVLLLLFFAPALSFSQITISSSDFANAGDTVRMSTTTDLGVDFSSTGANWSWDFSSFVAESQKLLDFKGVSEASSLSQLLFGGFAPVKYQASYFIASDDLPLDQLSTFLPVSITDVFQFSRVTADSISSVGFSITVEGNEVPFRSDTIEKRYQLPLNYQDSYEGRGYTEMDLNPIVNIIWRQQRLRESQVDGWGTIDLPIGTFDVLRVRHTITETDSIYNEFFGSPMWFGVNLPTAYIYEWIAPGEKEPVLRIQTSEVGGNETVTNIEYRDTYDPALAGIMELAPSPEIYPNPAQETIHIDQVPTGSSYAIIDANGSTVANGVLDASQAVSVASLGKGAYFLVIQSGTTWSKAGFVKE